MGEFIIEFVVEFLFEVVFEGYKSTCEDKKISKWIRYPLIAIAALVGLAIIGFFLLLSLSIMEDSLIGGFIILGIGLLILGYMIREFVKMYKNKKEELILEKEKKDVTFTDDCSNLTPSSDFFYYNDNRYRDYSDHSDNHR
jgi:hypothetical protein